MPILWGLKYIHVPILGYLEPWSEGAYRVASLKPWCGVGKVICVPFKLYFFNIEYELCSKTPYHSPSRPVVKKDTV